jgi:hypothetical protein
MTDTLNTLFDFNNLTITSDKNGYKLTNSGKKITFKTPVLETPFGIEYFNFKQIINFHLHDHESNTLIKCLRTFEKLFNQYSSKHIDKSKLPKINIEQRFTKDFENKTFMSIFRPGIKDGLLIRTYYTPDTEIYKIDPETKTKIVMQKKDLIKCKACIADIELANIWIHGKSYGLMIYVTSIEIQ